MKIITMSQGTNPKLNEKTKRIIIKIMEGISLNGFSYNEEELQPVRYHIRGDGPQCSAAYCDLSYEDAFYKYATLKGIREYLPKGGKWYFGEYRGEKTVLWLSPHSDMIPSEENYEKITKKEAVKLIRSGYCICSNY